MTTDDRREEETPGEIYLRRLTIEDALPLLDKFINDSFMAGLRQLRVVHGKGTGILRRAIRRELGRHSLVEFYRGGEYGEGGEGVTIVLLVPRTPIGTSD